VIKRGFYWFLHKNKKYWSTKESHISNGRIVYGGYLWRREREGGEGGG